MKGNNEISLNEATMIEAIQHFFDTVLFVSGKAPTVVSVKKESRGYQNEVFAISVSDAEKP